ncbi:MAG: hypothetical protein KatS3mg100_060 [Candidatus Parcubacteria bacterium]|nr:MAG: hypothetical protein KatS3mg100_060 [Candidatus Parcubacteria bacterium]
MARTQRHGYSHIDYKDVVLLKRYLDPHGRIRSRRVTGLTGKSQRMLARAVKNARYMGLIPYIQR